MRVKTLLIAAALALSVPAVVRADVTPPPEDKPKPTKKKKKPPEPEVHKAPVGRAPPPQESPMEGTHVSLPKRGTQMETDRTKPEKDVPEGQVVGTEVQKEGKRSADKKTANPPEYGDPPAK